MTEIENEVSNVNYANYANYADYAMSTLDFLYSRGSAIYESRHYLA